MKDSKQGMQRYQSTKTPFDKNAAAMTAQQQNSGNEIISLNKKNKELQRQLSMQNEKMEDLNK